jgi:hypothetical protein
LTIEPSPPPQVVSSRVCVLLRRAVLGVVLQRDKGLGFRVQGSGCRVQGLGFRVQGSGFRVQGLGFRV